MSPLAKLILAPLVLFFVITEPIFASDNLLQNPDFEQNANSSFSGWLKTPSTLTLSVSSTSGMTHNGNFAASFKSQTTSTKYLYQILSSPSGIFKLSAWLRLLSNNQNGFVRISWYSTSDGSGSELSSFDSLPISKIGDWQRVEVTSQTPQAAHSLRAKLALDPNSSELAELLFDEATLEKVDSLTTSSFLISLPDEINTGEEFFLKIDLKGLSQSSKYFLKVLGGESVKLSGELFDFYTWSPTKNSFLAWNASWSDFPSLTTNPGGEGEIEVGGKFTSDSFIGGNKIIVRLRKDGTTTNIDSDSVAILVSQPEVAFVQTDNGEKDPVIPGPFLTTTTTNRTLIAELDPAREGTISGQLLSSESGNVLAAEIPPLSTINLINSPEKVVIPTNDPSSFPWELPLLLVGGLLLGGSILTMIVKSGGWSFIRGIFLLE